MWEKIIGITPDYTRGDKIIVWSIFADTFGYQFGLCFMMVVIWNLFQPWPMSWWSNYYYIIYLVIGPLISLITTIWFFCGGVRDIRRLFKDLAQRVDNPLDNGMAEGMLRFPTSKPLAKMISNELRVSTNTVLVSAAVN